MMTTPNENTGSKQQGSGNRYDRELAEAVAELADSIENLGRKLVAKTKAEYRASFPEEKRQKFAECRNNVRSEVAGLADRFSAWVQPEGGADAAPDCAKDRGSRCCQNNGVGCEKKGEERWNGPNI